MAAERKDEYPKIPERTCTLFNLQGELTWYGCPGIEIKQTTQQITGYDDCEFELPITEKVTYVRVDNPQFLGAKMSITIDDKQNTVTATGLHVWEFDIAGMKLSFAKEEKSKRAVFGYKRDAIRQDNVEVRICYSDNSPPIPNPTPHRIINIEIPLPVEYIHVETTCLYDAFYEKKKLREKPFSPMEWIHLQGGNEIGFDFPAFVSEHSFKLGSEKTMILTIVTEVKDHVRSVTTTYFRHKSEVSSETESATDRRATDCPSLQ